MRSQYLRKRYEVLPHKEQTVHCQQVLADCWPCLMPCTAGLQYREAAAAGVREGQDPEGV